MGSRQPQSLTNKKQTLVHFKKVFKVLKCIDFFFRSCDCCEQCVKEVYIPGIYYKDAVEFEPTFSDRCKENGTRILVREFVPESHEVQPNSGC